MVFIEQVRFQLYNRLRRDIDKDSYSALLIVGGDGQGEPPKEVILIFQLLITAVKKIK